MSDGVVEVPVAPVVGAVPGVVIALMDTQSGSGIFGDDGLDSAAA